MTGPAPGSTPETAPSTTPPGSRGTAGGAAVFARFAYPPNALGYCGPAGPESLLERASAGAGADLRALARSFQGAWPYLQLIAGANGIDDPLEPAVVEAYWIGNDLLDAVAPAALAAFLDRHFAGVGAGARAFGDVVDDAARPHHNFHVFTVYPWVPLLARGVGPRPLAVLENCRIRWGEVEAVQGDTVAVVSRPLEFESGRLYLGAPRRASVAWRRQGGSFIAAPERGDFVAMHWDWVCDVVSPAEVTALERLTETQLEAVNSAAPA